MFKLRSLVLLVLVLSIATPALAQSPTAVATESADEYTVSVSNSKDLGEFLVGPNGMTLYSYSVDPLNDSTCVDKCATAWPPLTVKTAADLKTDEDIPGTFSTFARKDGTLQVAYNGVALYTWFKDTKAGDTTGVRVGRVWWVVTPATAYAQRIPTVGNVLVGAKGMTLYTYAKDTPGVSTCVDKCATAWPPLTVKTADAFVPGLYLPGKFDTTKRDDGTLQVTYNGWPLYYFAKDAKIGDATGEGVGKVWSTVVPETVATSNTKDLGDFLITPDGMTLYAFSKDTPGVSTCTGDCAKAWPAFTIMPGDRLAAGALKGKFDMITRDDKSIQVTYNGAPLYLFAKDKVPGDAQGQGVGGVWAVVKP